MMTYLKNMSDYKHSQLKAKAFAEIQGLYERQKRVIDDFKPIDSDDAVDKEKVLEEPDSTRVEVKQEGDKESIRKRLGKRLKIKATKKSKRQKTDPDLKEKEHLKTFLHIVLDKEGKVDYEGDLRTMFEETANDDLWKNQEEWILKSWNFYENYGVHTLTLKDGTEIYMLAERRYPLTKETLERMLALRLIAESDSEVVFDLLRFIKKQSDESGSHDGKLASPKQTALGKDISNPLIVDSLLKIIWLSMQHVIAMKHWLFQSKRLLITDVEVSLEQFKSILLAYREETSNRFDRMQESIDKNKGDADKQFTEFDEVEKDELILMSMDKDGMINKNKFAVVTLVVAVAPIVVVPIDVAPFVVALIVVAPVVYKICDEGWNGSGMLTRLGRYYTLDENYYLTFLDINKEMDLFAFICHSDPTKVRIGERELAKKKVKLLKLTEGRTISLNPLVLAALGDSGDSVDKLFDEADYAEQEHSVRRDDDVLEETFAKDVLEKLRDDYHAATSITGGKSLAIIRSLVPEGSSILGGIVEPQDDGLADSMSGLNLRTCPPSKRFKNLETFGDSASAGEANMNVASSSKLNEPTTSSYSFYASQDLDFETLHNIYIPKWKVTNDSVLNSSYVCRDSTDRLAPPALFSKLYYMDYDQLYIEFNVGAARQMCLGAEVRMRANTRWNKKTVLKIKTEAAEAIHLRSQLSIVEAADVAKSTELRDLKERNFALEREKDALFEKVATLESMTVSKETELASLTAQVAQLTSDLSGFQLSRDELSSKVAFLESERDRIVDYSSSLESAFELFKECMEAMKDDQAKVLGNKVAKINAQLLEMAAYLDEDSYPRFPTTISGRRWILTHGINLVLLKCLKSSEYLEALGQAIGCAVNKGIHDGLKAGVDHGKDGRDLSVIEAYDPSAEAKYIDVVNALGAVDFSLLSELKDKKDASMVDLMDSLCLEGPLAEIPRAKDLQPSPKQLILPLHRPKDNVVLRETSQSFSLQVVDSRVQRVRGEIQEKHLSLTDVMVPFTKPLSSKSLIGEASTSATHVTTESITTLSTTFMSSGVVHPLSISNEQVLDTEPNDADPPVVTFKKEELATSLE
uniref:Transposase (Putative), gypsy type n=1 Tax=Tanacetum cinerariifolium TaxID=118510 RepID=A0A6L2L464_TANCI|nr:hypothetical protein [Tanacetum cinerariifolium]